MDNSNKVRMSGPDLVRSFAALFVIAVHFYLSCGYYSEPLVGSKMFLMTVARWFFLICVPLFMMLTGFFKSRKTLCRAHYMGLIPVIVSYIVISLIKVFVGNQVYGKIFTFRDVLKNMFNYSFAWYVGMYICLMLLIPFLNILWNNIPDKKGKYILLGSLAFISTLYPVVKYVAPSYWQMLYPFVYYFFGAFVYEYRPKINKFILLGVIVICTMFNSLISFLSVKGSNFDWQILGPVDCGYSTITVALTAAAFFLIFYDADVQSLVVRTVLKKISEVSLEIYLFAAVYEIIIFEVVKPYVYNVPDYFWWFFALVPANFILSWVSSLIYKFLYDKCRAFILSRKVKQRQSAGEK